MANTDFKNCLGNIKKGSRIIEFQFNRDFDVENNIWYRLNNDFAATEWVQSLEYETTTKIYSGDPRSKYLTESFTETFEITMEENYNQAFYRELFDVMNTDDGLINFANGGLNIRITIYFDDMQWTRTTYNCCSPNPAQRPYHQMESSETTIEMPTTINYEAAIIEYNGFTIPLPQTIQDVQFVNTIQIATNKIDVSVSAVNDPSNLILNQDDNIRIVIYKNGVVWEVYYKNVSDIPFSQLSSTLTGGDYVAEISYLYHINSTGNFYRTSVVQKFTV